MVSLTERDEITTIIYLEHMDIFYNFRLVYFSVNSQSHDVRKDFQVSREKERERERDILGSEIDFEGLGDRIILDDRKGPKSIKVQQGNMHKKM